MMKLHMLNSRAISHPIHRLPLELLEYIFHLLFEIESDNNIFDKSPWDEAFPLNLTQVCSQWESLALSVRNRRLWSTVWIDPADPDWLERLHLHLFLSRDEVLDIHITKMTQSIVDELAGHHRRIRSLSPGWRISQIWDSTTAEPDTIQVVITDWSGKNPFSIPLSSSVTALPFVDVGEGSLRRLQSFSRLKVLQIGTQMPQLLELSGPLRLPALQRLLLVTHANPLDFLRIFSPSQLLDLHLGLSPAAYYELETFIIEHMPNLRSIDLEVFPWVDSVFMQPLEEFTAQPSSAGHSESLRRIHCEIAGWSKERIPPFERLIESAPHLEECYLLTPMKSLPFFGPHIRKLEFNSHGSPILPVVNGELFELVHLEVLKLTFTTAEQLQLLTLFQAPSLLSLEVSYGFESDSQSRSIPVDAILAFISTSRGIHDLELKLRFPVDSMSWSLPKLQNLKVACIRHISVLASFDVPKLQHLFLEIEDGRGSIAGGEDLAEDPTSIASPPPSFEAVGSSNVPGMVNTRQVLEIGNEAQTRNILEEDESGAEMNRFKDTDLHEAPSDPVVTRTPTFPALTFQHLKDFEFHVFTTSDSHPTRVLPYFSGIFTAFPALERVTLPIVPFDESPYIDQLVEELSKIPTLCPNLQEIRTCDYPNEWSNLLRFLRDRNRASIFCNPTLRPIHALHFPITPHGSIVEQLQDAMLGKVSIKSFPVLSPWPLRIDLTLAHIESSRGEDTWVDYDEGTRSQVQNGEERTAATHVQAQEEDMTGSGENERQSEEECGCSQNEVGALSCLFCHKAGLGAGCQGIFRKREDFSRMEVSSGIVLCSRWVIDPLRAREFEVVCLP